jgi:hypothetical protein
MKKIYLSLISALLLVSANAQITFGFDYKEPFENFTNSDPNSAVIIALYNANLDSTTRSYSAILSVVDQTAKPELTALNGTHFNITPPQQKVEFLPGQKGFRNEILFNINPVADNVFWGKRTFELNLTVYEGFTANDLAFGHQFITIYIDYDGSKIGIPRVDKSMFTVYPNPSSDNLYITGVNCQSIQILDLMGKVVLEQNTASNQINMETLPAGIYVLNAITDKGLLTQKIVKK